MMFPNGNYLKYFPDAELPESTRSGCLKIGACFAVKKVMKYYRLEERIGEIIRKNAGRFLDLAAYAIVTENKAAQYYPDYAYNHPLFTDGMKVYSDYNISCFLRNISRDDSIKFQNVWNKGRDHKEKLFEAYKKAGGAWMRV